MFLKFHLGIGLNINFSMQGKFFGAIIPILQIVSLINFLKVLRRISYGSRSAASRPYMARSARQEVDLQSLSR